LKLYLMTMSHPGPGTRLSVKTAHLPAVEPVDGAQPDDMLSYEDMLEEDAMSVRGAGETIKTTVSAWDGITAHAHRFGGTEYRLGDREIGHVHGDGLVDIPFPTKVRNEIVSAGQAQPHHVPPDSGWVSFYIRESEDIERAIALLRRSYEIAVSYRTRPRAQEAS